MVERRDVIDALEFAIGSYPEQRIGQVISNALRLAEIEDIFYIEDDDLLSVLYEYSDSKSSLPSDFFDKEYLDNLDNITPEQWEDYKNQFSKEELEEWAKDFEESLDSFAEESDGQYEVYNNKEQS